MTLRLAAALWIGLALAAPAWAQPDTVLHDPEGYAGSDRCGECHREKYDGWKQTVHATLVKDAKKNPEAVRGDFSAPGLGFTLDDVEYTIGGHREQRYMKKIGDDYYVLPKLWSVLSQTWRPYRVWGWRKMPYGKYCKGCHVTAYDPTGHVPVAENSIGCEACHGPGWDHVASGGEHPIVNPAKIPDDRRVMICAACHVRGKDQSGEYHFPVGYVPGEDLGAYYVPNDAKPGQTNSEAIIRLFAEWWQQLHPPPMTPLPIRREVRTNDAGTMEACFRCHQFRDRYSEHSLHPAKANVLCWDCHRKQDTPLDSPAKLDIHTPPYFLLHANDYYDNLFEPACLTCHPQETTEWATHLVENWRKPRKIDH